MQDLRRTLLGVPSCASESSRAGWVRVAVLSSANELGRTLIGICAPRDTCVSTLRVGVMCCGDESLSSQAGVWDGGVYIWTGIADAATGGGVHPSLSSDMSASEPESEDV